MGVRLLLSPKCVRELSIMSESEQTALPRLKVAFFREAGSQRGACVLRELDRQRSACAVDPAAPTQRHRQRHRPASGRPNPCADRRGWLWQARLSGIGQRLAFGWVGFRKAFWWVRADLLYLTEPLISLVGAGRFERPTSCAQGRCATRLRYAPTIYAFDSKLVLPDGASGFKRDRRRTVPKPVFG